MAKKKIPLTQTEKVKRAQKYVGTLDDANTPFDPEIHCVTSEGLPKRKKSDGTWQVKNGGRPEGYAKTGGIQQGRVRAKTLRVNESLDNLFLDPDYSIEKHLKRLYTHYPDHLNKLVLKRMDHENAKTDAVNTKPVIHRSMIVAPCEWNELQDKLAAIEAIGVVKNRDISTDIEDAEYTEVEKYDKETIEQEIEDAISNSDSESHTT